MEKANQLIEEIKQIAIQYRREVGSGRKPWPRSIRLRVDQLLESGLKAKQISDATGVPYFSILHWRSRDQKDFHELELGAAKSLPSPTTVAVAVPSRSAGKAKPAVAESTATVTVTTPDGFKVCVTGITEGLEILRRLRRSGG